MARFVSRYAAYSHGVREEISELTPLGRRVLQRSLEAQFDPRGLKDEEKQEAARRLSFHGLPESPDTASLEFGVDLSPFSRLSLFDSEKAQKHFKWTDEETDLVVETLRDSEMNGIEFVEVTPVRAKAPWASYDKLVDAEQIVELAIATETPIADVIAYERENQNREDLLVALRDLLDDEQGDEVEDESPITIEA